MVSELQAERNSFVRFFRQHNRESILIVLVAVAVIAATISWFKSEAALAASNKAAAVATTWQEMYKETERECRLAQMEVDDFRIILIREGLDPDHIGEKP